LNNEQENEEPRILIWFDIRKNKIDKIDIPWMATEKNFLEYKTSHHYYTIYSSKKEIVITKHIRGSIVREYENEFRCTPPRNNDDKIYVDCNGIKANIYSLK